MTQIKKSLIPLDSQNLIIDRGTTILLVPWLKVIGDRKLGFYLEKNNEIFGFKGHF